jgi:hypothetical protein
MWKIITVFYITAERLYYRVLYYCRKNVLPCSVLLQKDCITLKLPSPTHALFYTILYNPLIYVKIP